MRLIVFSLVAGVVLLPLAAAGSPALSGIVPGAVALAGFLIFGAALLLPAVARPRRRGEEAPPLSDGAFLAAVILAGFALRVLVAAAIHTTGLQYTIAPDEETFHTNGLQFCLWLEGETPYRLSWRFLDSLQVGYFYLVGSIYYLFGVVPFLPILLNCVLGALTAIPVFRIARELGGPEAGRPSAVFVTFFPSVLLWSTLLVRDTPVILCLMLIISVVMSLRRRFGLWRLAAFLALLVALGSMRQYLFLLVAACSVASFLVGRAGRTARSFAVGVLVILGLLVVVRTSGFGVWELERASLHNLNLHRQYNSVPSAGAVTPQVDISEPVSALTYLPVGMVYFLGSPFPWQVMSPRQIMALPDVLVWYALLPIIFIGLANAVRHRFRDASMLLLTITMITVLYALVEGNVGIIFRHRAQVIVPMMVFAGVGFAVRRARRAEKRAELVPVPEAARP